MSFFGRLFGSNKAIESGFDLVDKAFHTSEEKAEDALKATNAKINLLRAYEAFKLAQRMLALCYSLPYVTAWTVTFFASFWLDVDKQMGMLMESDIAFANIIILSFYFGGGAIEGVITKFAGVKKIGAKR